MEFPIRLLARIEPATSGGHAQSEFHARGERAWQEFLRTGQSCTAAEVSARLQSRIDAKRRELVSKSVRSATSV